ncbi:MAG TPA: hypothetical protein VF737_11070 [Gemmatimonadaceae bacterium]
MPSRKSLGLAVATLIVATAPLAAQTGRTQTPASLVGLANLSLGAGIGPIPSGTAWSASAEYLPFVTDHLQIGGGFSYAGSNGPFGAESGGLTAAARYLFGPNPRSAPYLSASVSASGGQHQSGVAGGYASVGWLHFLTPLTALDAQLFVSGTSRANSKTVTGLSAGPSVFLDGWRSSATGAVQRPWAYDWNASVNTIFSPTTRYGAGAQFAPFLADFLQVGIGGAFTTVSSQSGVVGTSHSYSANGLVRLYYPTDATLRPFVDAYGSTSRTTTSPASFDTHVHGASIGVRHYFSNELAIDARILRETTDIVGEVPIGVPPVLLRAATHRTQTRLSLGLTLHQPGR